jgi:U3 small nucleolar RNA-associated protein 22
MPILKGSATPHAAKKRKLDQFRDDPQLEDSEMGGGSSSDESPNLVDVFEETANEPEQTSQTTRQNRVKRNEKWGSDNAMLSSGGIGKSAMLTLQVNELLLEIRPDYEKQLSLLKSTLHKLKEIVESIPEVAPMTVAEAENSLCTEAGVSIPFPQPRPTKDTKYTFEYRKPTKIDIIGSLSVKLSVKGTSSIDMTITMPHSVFQDKDYLNHRIFHKRAYYLARIAAGIKGNAEGEFALEYFSQDDIYCLPGLIIKPGRDPPQGFSRSKVHVRILVAVPDSAFPIEKTLPTKNCLRPTLSNGHDVVAPTPFYNSCVRLACSYAAYHALLHKATLTCEAFRDVCLLGRIWLRQRGFSSAISSGGFGGFEFSAVCGLLLQHGGRPNAGPALSNKYNTLQLFKAVLQFLAGKDLTEPMILDAANLKIANTDYPVLFDGATGMNVLFKMTPWSYQLLRHEARLSLQAMNARSQDNFDSLFIIRSDEPLLRFDEVYRIDLSAIQKALAMDADARDQYAKMCSVLSKGLGDRVKLVHLKTQGAAMWPISKAKQGNKSERQFIDVGLLLNPDMVSRLVDHGPLAEEKEAAKTFRDFWGEKAELRRFKDGSISESLVWSEESPVTQQIINCVLQRHLHLPMGSITAHVSKFDTWLAPPATQLRPSDAFKLMNDAYHSFVNELYQLQGMPLSIRSISPADPQLRYASLHCPLMYSPASPANVLIQFEGSARWPDSLPAIQHTKIAFLVKLADLLSASNSTITTRIGLENTLTASSGHLNTSFLDVIYPSPAPAHALRPISFRIRIHHDRTLTLLESALSPSNKSALTVSARETLASALVTHKRLNLASPLHTTALSNLCTRHPALSPTIRLLKKWTASHLLSNTHIPDEILELLATHTFLRLSPFPTPSTPQTAFLRTLLFLSRWDWAAEPLILDFAETAEMTPQQQAEIVTRFTAWRKLDPAMNNVVLFVASTIDPTGVIWTQGARPSKVVAARLTALAKASIELVKAKGLEMRKEDWQSLFTTPMGDFDFVIHLNRHILRSHGRGSKGKKGEKEEKYKNLVLQEGMDIGEIGFDPVQLYLEDLEHAFGQNVLFFHNADGGRVIAGLWNPRALGRRAWRVRLGYSSMPVAAVEEPEGKDGGGGGDGEEKGSVVMNQSGILGEIAMMGEGLVERVEIVKELAQRTGTTVR